MLYGGLMGRKLFGMDAMREAISDNISPQRRQEQLTERRPHHEPYSEFSLPPQAG